MDLIKILFLILFAVACAARGRQTDAFLKTQYTIPEEHKIADVPFIKQTQNHCGPASLAMMMSHAKVPVTLEELTSQMYTPGKSGTFQTDLIAATRRQGMLAVIVEGNISSLLQEIAAGNPVLIFENLGVNWYPLWHYAVAVGYDLSKPVIILHSAEDKFLKTNLRRFEEEWAMGNHWAVVILKPGEISKTGNDLVHVAAAAGLEQVGKIKEAETSYLSILKKWPNSLTALIGMGNITYNAKKYDHSLWYLERAVERHPESALAWHNLTIAYGTLGKLGKARESAKKALELADETNSTAFQENLKIYLN